MCTQRISTRFFQSARVFTLYDLIHRQILYALRFHTKEKDGDDSIKARGNLGAFMAKDELF